MIEKLTTGDLLELKEAIENILPDLEMDIMFFPLDGSDEDFNFLLKKGVYYREQLKQINQELKNRIKK